MINNNTDFCFIFYWGLTVVFQIYMVGNWFFLCLVSGIGETVRQTVKWFQTSIATQHDQFCEYPTYT